MLISYFKHILSQRSLKSHRITLGKFRGQSVDQNKHCPALSARPTHITQRTLTLLWFSQWTTEYCFVVLALWPAATMKLKLLLLLLVFFCTFIIPAQVRFKPPSGLGLGHCAHFIQLYLRSLNEFPYQTSCQNMTTIQSMTKRITRRNQGRDMATNMESGGEE